MPRTEQIMEYSANMPRAQQSMGYSPLSNPGRLGLFYSFAVRYLHVRSGIDIGERVWREKWLGEIEYGCDTDVILM